MKRKDFKKHIFWNMVKMVFKYPDARQLMRWISEDKLTTKYVGDLILEVEGESVENVDALRRTLEQIAAEKKTVVVLKILRGIHTLYLELEPDWKG